MPWDPSMWGLPGPCSSTDDVRTSPSLCKRALHNASLLPLFSKREAKHNTYNVRTSPESGSRKRQASAKEKPLQKSSAKGLSLASLFLSKREAKRNSYDLHTSQALPNTYSLPNHTCGLPQAGPRRTCLSRTCLWQPSRRRGHPKRGLCKRALHKTSMLPLFSKEKRGNIEEKRGNIEETSMLPLFSKRETLLQKSPT